MNESYCISVYTANNFLNICQPPDRLQPNESLINGLIYPPSCMNTRNNITFVCGCNENTAPPGAPINSYVNCTLPSKTIQFRSSGTDNCVYSSTYRKKRELSSNPQDDLVLTPDSFQIDVTVPTSIATPPSFTWPTANGITSDQAKRTCQAKLQNLIVYAQCQPYVQVDNIITDCVMDVAVSCVANALFSLVLLYCKQRCK